MASYSKLYTKEIVTTDAGVAMFHVEAAVPIVLAASNPARLENVIEISGITSDIEVYAQEVTIRGQVNIPGANVTIMTEVLRGEEDASGAPQICVDGAPGDPPPDGLAKGRATVDGITKVTKGNRGSDGTVTDYNGIKWNADNDRPGGKGQGGSDSDETRRTMEGAPGATGAPGSSGGTITIMADRLAGSRLTVSAKGGKGGGGQNGQPGADGGDGGEGASRTKIFLQNWGPTAGGNGGDGGNGGPGGRGGPGGAGGTITTYIVEPDFGQLPKVIVDGGAGGPPGRSGAGGSGGTGGKGGLGATESGPVQGGPAGGGGRVITIDPAPDGVDGACGISPKPIGYGDTGAAGNAEQKYLKRDELAGHAAKLPVPVTHLQALFNQYRLNWLGALGYEKQNDKDETALGLARIRGLLTAICRLDGGNKPFSSGLLAEVVVAHSNYLTGRDPFGNGRHTVPLLTYKTHTAYARQAIETLKSIETYAEAFLNHTADEKSGLEAARLMHHEAAAAHRKWEDTLGEEIATLKRIEAEIEAAETERKTIADTVIEAGDWVRGEIAAAFDLTPEQLTSALSTFAFMADHPGPGMAMQAAAQAGELFAEGSSQVVDSFGDAVKKSYLMRDLRTIDGAQLKGELKAHAGGYIDGSASLRLMAKLGEVKTLFEDLGQAANGVATRAFTAAIGNFIAAITKRNDRIFEYNVHMSRVIDLKGAAQCAEAQMKSTGEAVVAKTDPGKAALLSYVLATHERARNACLRQIIRVARARDLLLLDESRHSLISSDPREFNSVIADETLASIHDTLVDALETSQDPFGPFPASDEKVTLSDDSAWYPSGVIVVLDPSTHPWVFDDLSFFGAFSILLLPPTGSSPLPTGRLSPTLSVCQPGSDDQGGPRSENAANPFSGYPNVRLRSVRVFLEGLASDARAPLIRIRHSGQERFSTKEGILCPRNGMFEHAQTFLAFQYRPSEYAWDDDMRISAKALEGEGIAERGHLTAPPVFDNVDSAYAGIGPFAEWEFTINGAQNPGIDLDKVTRILIDFHGICQSPK